MSRRVAGIDFGLARIGIALSDPSQIIASPFKTIANQKTPKETAVLLLKELSEYNLDEIVVGMPYRLNGTSSHSSEATRDFVNELKEHTAIPVKLWDERLTTVQVEREMKAGNMSRKKRSKVIDEACAALILQSYLEQKGNSLIPACALYD